MLVAVVVTVWSESSCHLEQWHEATREASPQLGAPSYLPRHKKHSHTSIKRSTTPLLPFSLNPSICGQYPK